MVKLKDKTVLITGGASGIGKVMVKLALERGAKVIIWDINKENTEALINECAMLGNISGYLVDVSDKAQVDAVYYELKKRTTIDVLINNAGIVAGKYFHEHTLKDIRKTLDINVFAPMYITSLFIQDMMVRNSGYICNIASSAGLISNPRMSVYAGSKWAVIGWSDSLRLEMRKLKKNIGVTTVTPYYINTGMFEGVRSRIPLLQAEQAGRKIIRAIELEHKVLSMPWSMRLVRFFQGILPISVFDWCMEKPLGIYSTMDKFTGRNK